MAGAEQVVAAGWSAIRALGLASAVVLFLHSPAQSSPSCDPPSEVPSCAGVAACSGCGDGTFCCSVDGGCNSSFSNLCMNSQCTSSPSSICLVGATPTPPSGCQPPSQVPQCASGTCSGCSQGTYCCQVDQGCNANYTDLCMNTQCMSSPGSICQVSGSTTPTSTSTTGATPSPTPGPATPTVTLAPTGAAPTPTGTPTQGPATPTAPPGSHPITIINNCTEQVWVGYQSSALSGGFALAPLGQQVLAAPHGWNSGTIWARTGCTFDGAVCPTPGPQNNPPANCCDTGGCTNAAGSFALACANSPAIPVTLAEFTLDSPYDTYDVSMVSGGNVSVSIVPNPITYTIQPGIDPNRQTCTTNANCDATSAFTQCVPALGCVNPYYCASPGCTATNGCASPSLQASLLPSSPWAPNSNFAIAQSNCPADIQYMSRQNQGTAYVGCSTPQKFCRTACQTSAQCPAPQTCPGGGGFCENASGAVLGAPCDTTIDGTTYDQLWGCTGVNSGSCFTAGAGTKCCGCPSWVAQSLCQNNNTDWQSVAAPIFSQFHAAAPTVYSFPYDDQVGTYTCNPATAQTTAYSITFCGQIDNDADGVRDLDDIDADNDGILDAEEAVALNRATDTDGDGVPDIRDLDSDDDGVSDLVEAGGIDKNGDGLVDDFVDANHNGWDDHIDPLEGGHPLPLPDSDGDGIPDFQDSSGTGARGNDGCGVASGGALGPSPLSLLTLALALLMRRRRRPNVE